MTIATYDRSRTQIRVFLHYLRQPVQTQQPAIRYGDLSHIKVIISHEAKLSGM